MLTVEENKNSLCTHHQVWFEIIKPTNFDKDKTTIIQLLYINGTYSYTRRINGMTTAVIIEKKRNNYLPVFVKLA